MSTNEAAQTTPQFALSFRDSQGQYPNWKPSFGQLCTSQKNQPARYLKTDASGKHLCVVIVAENDLVVAPATPHLPDHKPAYHVINFDELEKLAREGRFA